MADTATGMLKLSAGGIGVLLDPATAYQPSGQEVRVPASLVRAHGLVDGALVFGPVRMGRKASTLTGVGTVCGLAPKVYAARRAFAELVPIDPNERFDLSAAGELSMRMVDLVAPIGKGTRGLIVAPPKAGKTTLLEHIAQGVRTSLPAARIIVLLIDERPEEVTYFRRAVRAEVFASSSDVLVRSHIALAELMLAHVRVELECGRDVLVLLDSLTRLVRATNLGDRGRNRSLSGGLEAGALEMPRRLFGMARNIEGGGSVTIIATALIDTGSRMDQVIYEELKSTGNSEIVLDRSLAEAHLFPAIDILASGTRKEGLLYDAEDGQRLTKLRAALAKRAPRQALLALQDLLARYPTNEALLRAIPIG